MIGVIDPTWTFEEAVAAASRWYAPGGISSGPARNAAIEAWASVVGRDRALAGLADALASWGSRTAAARALSMSPRTFTRFEQSFSAMAVQAAPHGLTLMFDSRLHRFDPTAFNVLIAEVLGPETDVGVEEQSRADAAPGFLRINGRRGADLVRVAEAFYDRVWRGVEAEVEKAAMERALSSGMAMMLTRLDDLRGHLMEVKASSSVLNDEDVREAITDMAGGHVKAKRKREFSTPLQRIAAGLVLEVPNPKCARTSPPTVGGGSAASNSGPPGPAKHILASPGDRLGSLRLPGRVRQRTRAAWTPFRTLNVAC